MTIWRHEDGPILSLNTAKREQDEARTPGVPLLHFGHSNAWASRYLAARGEELRREWLAKTNAVAVRRGKQTIPSSSSSSSLSSSSSSSSSGSAPAPFSVAFYVQAAQGDPGVAVDAL